MRSTIIGSAAALIGLFRMATAASTPVAYTDPNTGIDFQQYSATGVEFSLGIAFPKTIESDFIGQLAVPITKTGAWGAVSLGGGMLNHLLLVAWANGEEVVSTFRTAGAYANPAVYDATEVSALPIANGTFVNSTHFSFTFLCKGCIVGGDTTFKATDDPPVLGWALSSSNPTTLSDPASEIPYHDAGFGLYGQPIAAAQSANFETWASWASKATIPAPGAGNSTLPVPGNTTTPAPTVSNATYDVIVVGGGTAGIIAAERIAEAGSSVLLIERGPANTVALGSKEGIKWNNTLTPYDIPALGSSLSGIPGTKICSDTASMAGCLLGGSSSINGENFIHPPQHDFENWPADWSWNDVSKAADRLYSRNPGTTQPSVDGKHYDDMAYNVVSSYLDAQGWTNVDSIETPNEKRMVYSRPAWSIVNNLRAGPARTYMPFAQELDNFTLQLGTKVIQVQRTGSSITGVLVQLEDGSQQIINLKQGGKVVLAAGALSTPRVLWNSGIGKSDALKIVQGGTTGVKLPAEADWIDLPVGHGLKDHAQAPLQFKTSANYTAYKYADIPTNPVESDVDLYKQGSGVLTQAGQRMHLWTSVNGTDGRERYLQGTVSSMKDNTVTIRTFLTHGTTSTGELGITAGGNTVLNVKPWLVDEGDREAMSGFVQWWMDLTGHSNSSVTSAIALPKNATATSLLAETLISGDHWVGTTKMGTDDGRTNGTSVVDTDTRVYGTDNLFVVDASIHPDLPTGNTQAIIMIVAEHAAEKIAAFKVANGTSNATPTAPSTIPSSGTIGNSTATPSSVAIGNSTAPSAIPSATAVEKEYTLPEFIAFLEKADAAGSSSTTRRKRDNEGRLIRRYV